MTVKWNEVMVETDKEANDTVPEGMYDVIVEEVVKIEQKNNPGSFKTMITFASHPEGKVPPIFVNSALKNFDAKKQAYTRYMAAKLTNEVYQAAHVDPSAWDLDEIDPMFDGLRRIVGERMRVLVQHNPKTGWMESVPVVQGI